MNKGTIKGHVPHTSSPNLLRLTSSWGLAAALILLGAIGIVQAWSLFSKMDQEELGRIEGELQRLVLDTELDVSMRAREWLSEVENSVNEQDTRALAFREQELRKEWPFFDAFYIWEEGDSGIELHYPKSNSEDSIYQQHLPPKLLQAQNLHEGMQYDQEALVLQEIIDEALRYLHGEEIGPSIELLSGGWQSAIDALIKTHPEATVRAIRSLDRLEKRHKVYQNIATATQSVLPLGLQQQSLFYEISGDPTLLIATRRVGVTRRFIAVQVNQMAILQSMLLHSSSLRRYLVIRDAQGNRLAGNPTSEPELVEVPFRTLLPHLRLACKEGLLKKRQSDHQWSLLWQIIPILIAVLLGAFALSARQTADRNAQALLSRQREFVTRVTHELKTPLAGIRVMAESLEMGAYEEKESVREFAMRIVAETDRLDKRVEEVLEIGKQRRPHSPESLNLVGLLEELARVWEPRFENSGIALHQELKPVPDIRGDAKTLRDAVACLLDNALKYHDSTKSKPTVWLRLSRKKARLVIEVADNGLGVPPNKRTEIFERFARVEGGNRGKAGGHGLGLAFAQETTEQHHGQIQCLDGVDGGVCFKIFLPLKGLLSRRIAT